MVSHKTEGSSPENSHPKRRSAHDVPNTQDNGPSKKRRQNAGFLKSIAEPTFAFASHVFYRILGGGSASHQNQNSAKAVKAHSQIIIEIPDDEVDPKAAVIHLYTLRRKIKESVADKQFKTIAQNKYKIVSDFAFSNGIPNIPSLREKLVELNIQYITKKPENIEHVRKRASELLNHEWVVDEFINKYMERLCPKNKDVITISSFCHSQPDFVKRLRERKKFNAPLKQIALDAKTILWPICDNSHWYLIAIKKNDSDKYDISCLDGLNSPERSKYLDKAEEMLAALLPHRDPKTLIGKKQSINIPIQSYFVRGAAQTNYVDCGPAICYWAAQIAKGVDIAAIPHRGACDYSEFRLDIAKTLIEENNKPKSRITITID